MNLNRVLPSTFELTQYLLVRYLLYYVYIAQKYVITIPLDMLPIVKLSHGRYAVGNGLIKVVPHFRIEAFSVGILYFCNNFLYILITVNDENDNIFL